MKRTLPRKLRDRRGGVSPYQRHQKAPYRYSTAYYEWRNRISRRKDST